MEERKMVTKTNYKQDIVKALNNMTIEQREVLLYDVLVLLLKPETTLTSTNDMDVERIVLIEIKVDSAGAKQ